MADGHEIIVPNPENSIPNYGLNTWAKALISQEGVKKTQRIDQDDQGKIKFIFNGYVLPNGDSYVERQHVGANHTDPSGYYFCLQNERTGKVVPESYWDVAQIEEAVQNRSQK